MRSVFLVVLVPLLQTALCTANGDERTQLGLPFGVHSSDADSVRTDHQVTAGGLPRRGLLARASKSCVWNTNASTCASSPAVETDILRSSKNEFASLWMHIKKCLAQGTDEDECIALDECGWNRQSQTCEFVDYLGQYPDSPCVSHAPLTFDYIRLSSQCPSRTSARTCRRLEGCSWDGIHDSCYADLYHIYFGVESRAVFSLNFVKIDQAKLATGLSEISSEVIDPKKKKQDWDSILSVKVPKTDCPESADELICDYVDAHLPHMFPQHAYCFFRYREDLPTVCNKDKLCRYNDFQGCVHKHEIMIDSLAKADKVLLDLLDEPTDKHLAREFLRCDRVANKADCKGNCRWLKNTCVISRNYMDEEFLKSAEEGKTTDPICQFYQMQLDSDCLDIDDLKMCHKKKNCDWNGAIQECDVANDEIREALIREDPKLEKPLNEAIEKCEPQKNERACNKA